MSREKNIDKGTGRTDSARSFFKPLEGLGRLEADPVIDAVFRACPEGSELYLVGGVVRNIALQVEGAPDYDFATNGDTLALAASVAERLGGSFFALDEEAGAWRVASKQDNGMTIDFTPLLSGDIVSDLGKRDFTVNAMAIPIGALLKGEGLVIDPFNGLDDAKRRAIRTVSDKVFDDDPLRLMRAVRLSVQYGLNMDEATRKAVSMKPHLLPLSSPERIRDELVQLMASSDAHQGVLLLHETGLLEAMVPEMKGWSDISGYDLLSHSLSVLFEAGKLLQNIGEDTFPGLSERLKEYLFRPGPVANGALFGLAALFHDFGKAYTLKREGGKLRFIGHDSEGASRVGEVMDRLRFSKKTVSELSLLIKNHHRVFMLAALDKMTFRAKGHFFRVMGGEPGIMLLCLALSDARATRGGEDPGLYKVVLEMMHFFYGVYTVKKPAPLMTGSQVMETFRVKEGPVVGEILKKIGEGIEAGAVSSRKEAVLYVRRWLKERRK